MSRPNVYADGPWDMEAEKMQIRSLFVGLASGAKELGASMHELLPGSSGFNLHAHYAIEELFVVLSGRPTLRTPGGRSIGSLQITVQDIIGFIKLERKLDHAGIVVVGSGGRMRTSLPAAAGVALPRAGCVEIAARRFVVSSFRRLSYTGEPLTIWVLSRS